jgi:hypothetical protein
MKRILKAAVPVTQTQAAVLTLLAEGELSGGFRIKNAGANPLTGFETFVKLHGDDAWMSVAAVAGDYNSSTSKKLTVIDTTVSPVTLAAGAETVMTMSLERVAQVKFEAKTGAGLTTTLDIAGITK